MIGAEHVEPNSGQPVRSGGACNDRSPTEVAAEHERPPHCSGGNLGCFGNRIGHKPFEGTLADFADEQPADEAGLLGGRSLVELCEHRRSATGRALARCVLDRLDQLVELVDGDGRNFGVLHLDR